MFKISFIHNLYVLHLNEIIKQLFRMILSKKSRIGRKNKQKQE